MARCAKCGGENEVVQKFCGQCGAKFSPMPDAVSAGEDGLYYCWKHKKETTRVTCGRCEKPICPQCMIPGPAGVRCRECARNKTPFRPRAVVHGATSLAGRMNGRTVWWMYIWAMIIRIIGGFFGGR